MRFAEIIVTKRTRPNHLTFTYSVPLNLRKKLKKGQIVEVPFGRQIVLGVVLRTMQETNIAETKDIQKIISETPLLNQKQFELAELISKYYHCALGTVVKAIAPSYVRGKIIYKINYYKGTRRKPKSKKQEKVLDFLKKHPGNFPLKEIANRVSVSENLLKQMIKNQLIKSTEEIHYPDPLATYKTSLKPIPTFNNLPKINLANSPIHLLFDQTGTTKNKIYLEQIQKIVSKNKQVLLITPEIRLTPAIIKQFLSYFPDQVAIWHGKLSRSHKIHQWLKIQTGQAKIIIGSRSSLFCPFKNLGLIILDDEHDSSYKQEQSPRYHARKVALMLNKLQKVPVILGSASPSIESYYYSQKGKYKFTEVTDENKPDITITDLTKELQKGHKSIFGDDLLDALTTTLRNKKQAILFLNRRGNSPLVICKDCGHTMTCPRCNIPLTYHTQNKNLLRCHHCYHQTIMSDTCPDCKGDHLNYLGLGTQKIETEIQKFFPKTKVLRIDKDSANTKSKLLNIYHKFQTKKADILIGTKMIQQFLHLKNVSLFGVMNADTLLNLPDFRNQEKTFQLLNQFRILSQTKNPPAQIIIQTYIPNNLVFEALVQNDYQKLLDQELKNRRELNYPPFGQLIKLIHATQKEEKCLENAEKLKKNLIKFQEKIGLTNIDIIGPTAAFIPRVNNQYRYYLILKGKQVRKLLPVVPASWKIDIDPESLL